MIYKINRIINFNDLLIKITFIAIYILPINYLRRNNLNIDQYLFMLVIAIYYLNYILKECKIRIKDIVVIIISIYFCALYSTFNYLHLIGLIVMDKLLDNQEEIAIQLNKNRIIFYFCLLSTIVYSIIYFGHDGRYIFTGLREPNQGGFSLFLLFVIFSFNNKFLGNTLLLLGLLTFSRNYFLALLVYYTVEFYFLNPKMPFKTIFLNFFGDFKKVSILTIILLIIIAFVFINLDEKGLIQPYQEGLNRYIVFFDTSNYFRFTTNTNLLYIYKQYPENLLTGLGTEEFIEKSFVVSSMKNQRFRAIIPHNFFFSYLRIYGVFSLGIFYYLATLFNKVVTKKNIHVFLVIIIYITFLGIGVTSYWLFITMFTLISINYKEANKQYEKIQI